MFARFLVTILLLLHCAIGFGQKTITGTVVDKKTGEAIPSVSVTLILEKAGTSADEKGQFKLEHSKQLLNDTLQFRAIGYIPFKILLKTFKSSSFIELAEEARTLNQVNVTGNQKERTLGKVPGYIIGRSVHVSNLKSIAKKFDKGKAYGYLRNIIIHRTLMFMDIDLKHNPKTRFNLKIYAVDQKTGGPGKAIYKEDIEVEDLNNHKIIVSITDKNIFIPDRYFYIAVEKQLSPFNERYVLTRLSNLTDQGIAPANYSVYYQPYLFCDPSNSIKCWVKGYSKEWVQMYNDPAIEATMI